jgi:hypothetical protein
MCCFLKTTCCKQEKTFKFICFVFEETVCRAKHPKMNNAFFVGANSFTHKISSLSWKKWAKQEKFKPNTGCRSLWMAKDVQCSTKDEVVDDVFFLVV